MTTGTEWVEVDLEVAVVRSGGWGAPSVGPLLNIDRVLKNYVVDSIGRKWSLTKTSWARYDTPDPRHGLTERGIDYGSRTLYPADHPVVAEARQQVLSAARVNELRTTVDTLQRHLNHVGRSGITSTDIAEIKAVVAKVTKATEALVIETLKEPTP